MTHLPDEGQVKACDKVEKLKMVYEHYYYTKVGVEWFLCRPKMANCKSGGPKMMQW